jgi:HD-GYP domain-containing protein (c-di-GMP phosphodiesterase class II)
MGVPDNILLKPGPLTPDEWVSMRQHTDFAKSLLANIDYLRASIDIPYSHHEKWDGSGYPQGLKGGRIPLAARIFTVVDVFDALTHDRPYRPAWSIAEAKRYLGEQSGRQFDPDIVNLFLDLC